MSTSLPPGTLVLLALLAPAAVLLWPSRTCRSLATTGAARRPEGASSTARRGPRALGWRRRRPESRDVEDVADSLVLLGLALRAGTGLAESLALVARSAPPEVRADLESVVAALRWGLPAERAWSYAGEAWRPVAAAYQLAASTGASPVGLLAEAAGRLREDLDEERARRAARAGVLLVLPLGLGFLPAFACTAVVPVVLSLAAGVLG